VLPFALLTSFSPRLHVTVGIANTIVMSSSSTQETSRSGNLSLVHICSTLTIFNSPNFILPEFILISTFKWSRSSNLRWPLRWEQEIFPYISFDTHCIHFSSQGLSKEIGILILEMVPLHTTLNHRHVSHKVINSFNVNYSAWLFGMVIITNPGCCFSFQFFTLICAV